MTHVYILFAGFPIRLLIKFKKIKHIIKFMLERLIVITV